MNKRKIFYLLFLGAALVMQCTPAAASYTATWTKLADVPALPAGPGKRAWVRMTYDPMNKVGVLWGGSGASYYNDIWNYDLGTQTWTKVAPFVDCDQLNDFVPPAKRDEYIFQYDPANNLFWLYGGGGNRCSGPKRTAQIGSNTTTLIDAALPALEDDAYKDWTVLVGSATAYVAAYKASTHTLTLSTPIKKLAPGAIYQIFTQRGGGTWYYSPTDQSWTGFDGPHWTYAGASPPGLMRHSPALAYSTWDKAMIMFGGNAATGYGDTWALDALTKSWVRMLPAGPESPPMLSQLQNGMAYDSADDVFILFGGRCEEKIRCSYHTPMGDTWVYKISSNSWTNMRPAASPPPRYQHYVGYDPDNGVTIAFGGGHLTGGVDYVFNDLWIYDYSGNTWTKLSPAISPPPVKRGAFYYDSDQKEFIFYGGRGVKGDTKEMWALKITASGSAGTLGLGAKQLHYGAPLPETP